MSSLNTNIDAQLKPTKERWLLAAILFITVFFAYVDRVNVSVLVADSVFLADMGISDAVQKGMLMTTFLIAYGLGNVILSPLGDIFGPRKAMAGCIIIWGISMLVGGLAATYTMIVVSRVLLGLGEGLHFPMQSKYVKLWFPPAERGKANAVWQTGVSVAPAIALPFFTWIIYYTGWRSSFFALAALTVVPLLAVWFFAPDTPRQSKRVNKLELDYIEEGQAREAAAEENQANAVKPSLAETFKTFSGNYRFWLMCLFFITHVSIFFGALTWLPSYLKEARGFSWAAMGALSSLPFVIAVGAKILAGYLCDKTKKRSLILLLEMVGIGIGTYFAAHATDNNMAAMFLILGIGANGFGGPTSWTMLQSIVPGKGIGSAAGMMNGIANGFAALAPVAIGYLISTTGSYVGGLYYIIGCSVLGSIMALVLYTQEL